MLNTSQKLHPSCIRQIQEYKLAFLDRDLLSILQHWFPVEMIHSLIPVSKLPLTQTLHCGSLQQQTFNAENSYITVTAPYTIHFIH